jgi:hypothetical protein
MSFRAEDVVFYFVGRNKQGESNAKKYLSKQKRIGRTHVKKNRTGGEQKRIGRTHVKKKNRW